MDHRAEFWRLVFERYGKAVADAIEWKQPRLLCIAGDFTKYDEHAVQEIPRNIELLRYRRYGEDLLLIELAAVTSGDGKKPDEPESAIRQQFSKCSIETKDRYERLRATLLAVGDEVQEREQERYFSFRRMKNFAYVRFSPQTNRILINVNINPTSITLEPGFTQLERPSDPERSMLTVAIRNDEDLERAMPLLRKSCEAS